jgi:hypothetical protein
MQTVKSIIRDALDHYPSYSSLMRAKDRGQTAADLLTIWEKFVQFEAVNETEYSQDKLMPDLLDTMRAHGTPEFADKCRELGEKIAIAAADYVLSSHESEGEDAETDRYQDEREAEEERGWERDLNPEGR